MVMTTESRPARQTRCHSAKGPQDEPPRTSRLPHAAAVTVTVGLIAARPRRQWYRRALVGHGVVFAGLSAAAGPGLHAGGEEPGRHQSTIGSTICVPGWTATIRSSTTYTNVLKKQGIIDYG